MSIVCLALTRNELPSSLKASFSEEEMVELTLLITTINAWNRFQCGFQAVHPMKVKNAAAA